MDVHQVEAVDTRIEGVGVEPRSLIKANNTGVAKLIDVLEAFGRSDG